MTPHVKKTGRKICSVHCKINDKRASSGGKKWCVQIKWTTLAGEKALNQSPLVLTISSTQTQYHHFIKKSVKISIHRRLNIEQQQTIWSAILSKGEYWESKKNLKNPIWTQKQQLKQRVSWERWAAVVKSAVNNAKWRKKQTFRHRYESTIDNFGSIRNPITFFLCAKTFPALSTHSLHRNKALSKLLIIGFNAIASRHSPILKGSNTEPAKVVKVIKTKSHFIMLHVMAETKEKCGGLCGWKKPLQKIKPSLFNLTNNANTCRLELIKPTNEW